MKDLTHSTALRRYAAFTDDPSGGNRAGVWTGDALPEPATMQRIATEVGYSETAFVQPLDAGLLRVRYYSPRAEVSFCGHATIAAGVDLGTRRGAGTYVLETAVGNVPVAVEEGPGGFAAALTSVEPRQEAASAELLDGALDSLGWRRDELDPAIPPVSAYAGAWHLVLAAATHDRLRRLDYDFERLLATMLRHGLTTVQLVWRESDRVFHARNPFPVGGVVEDAATGASAAALGGYLRALGAIATPASLLVRQGEDTGRPSRIEVRVPRSGGITVAGRAVAIDAGPIPLPRTGATRDRRVTRSATLSQDPPNVPQGPDPRVARGREREGTDPRPIEDRRRR